MEDTREIAISLLREVGSSRDRDIVRPKRMGVGITFEVVGSLCVFPNISARKLSLDYYWALYRFEMEYYPAASSRQCRYSQEMRPRISGLQVWLDTKWRCLVTANLFTLLLSRLCH